MSLTITLSDELTQRLEDQARRFDVPVAEWVMKILARASDRPDENTTWEKLNARRFELIEKRFDGGLTTLEAEELDGKRRKKGMSPICGAITPIVLRINPGSVADFDASVMAVQRYRFPGRPKTLLRHWR